MNTPIFREGDFSGFGEPCSNCDLDPTAYRLTCGAIDAFRDLTVYGSMFTGNNGREAGAIAAAGLTIEGSTLTDNAGFYAGAIRSQKAVALTDTIVAYNTSDLRVGAVQSFDTVTCGGDEGVSGIYANIGGGIHASADSSAVGADYVWLTTSDCDFGTDSLDNTAFDVKWHDTGRGGLGYFTATLGDDESITCSDTGCL